MHSTSPLQDRGDGQSPTTSPRHRAPAGPTMRRPAQVHLHRLVRALAAWHRGQHWPFVEGWHQRVGPGSEELTKPNRAGSPCSQASRIQVDHKTPGPRATQRCVGPARYRPPLRPAGDNERSSHGGRTQRLTRATPLDSSRSEQRLQVRSSRPQASRRVGWNPSPAPAAPTGLWWPQSGHPLRTNGIGNSRPAGRTTLRPNPGRAVGLPPPEPRRFPAHSTRRCRPARCHRDVSPASASRWAVHHERTSSRREHEAALAPYPRGR